VVARGRLVEAERAAQRLETEAGTLRKLLAPETGRFRPVLDSLSVRKGYETALGAALGEDLEASLDSEAPAHWSEIDGSGNAPLPEGIESLLAFVDAPAALTRRLRQVGVASRADGKALQRRLAPGQRLVSREGDSWRWDGFTVAADAPTPAAQRLAERNRLGEIEIEARAARAAAEALRAEHDLSHAALRAAAEAETAARAALRTAQARAREAREALARAERTAVHVEARASALADASARLVASLDEARAAEAALEAGLAALDEDAALAARLPGLRAAVDAERRAASEARSALARLERETAVRASRRDALRRETESWRKRIETAARQAETLEARRRDAEKERAGLEDAPGQIFETRRALMLELDEAEAARKTAADRLAAGERALDEADRAGRDRDRELGDARAAQARAEAQLEAARERRAEAERHIFERFDMPPTGLYALAELKLGDPLAPVRDLDSRLDGLRRDRERLGPVNLRAETEAQEVEAQHGALRHESEDLVEAIQRLRQGIAALNREGRERLTASFGQVNAHFQSLFGTLFGGGTAELMLIESDDPLEAGLEIVARPPGKRPQTLTLLSGGEQALTALSLIFAVFLTNPSPICVLDEVDAPLDDANVDRFCDLLDEMRRRTETRFLVVTHNPLTMARMDRLYGVTMAERGISSLVSVDLETAGRFREAG
jgi:chromosome segregation protein